MRGSDAGAYNSAYPRTVELSYEADDFVPGDRKIHSAEQKNPSHETDISNSRDESVRLVKEKIPPLIESSPRFQSKLQIPIKPARWIRETSVLDTRGTVVTPRIYRVGLRLCHVGYSHPVRTSRHPNDGGKWLLS